MRRALLLAAACALAPAAGRTEPFDGPGYLLACGEEGCLVAAAGYTLFAPADGGAAMAVLGGLDPLSAVRVAGALSEMGDATATLHLTHAEAVDTPDEGNLRALQGHWRPLGEETPFHIEILGLDWTEVAGSDQTPFRMSLGPACADGVEPGGTAISLYPLGADPSAVACWQIDYVDDTTLILRDFPGVQGAVEFTRVVQ